MNSLPRKDGFSERNIKKKMQSCDIFNKSLQNTDIFVKLRKFVQFKLLQGQTQSISEQQFSEAIGSILKIIKVTYKVKWQINWMKLLIFHSISQVIGFCKIQSGFIHQILLIQTQSTYRQIISKQTIPQNPNLFRRSLNKIKSIKKISAIFSLGQQNTKSIQKEDGQKQLITNVLIEYALYLKKIFADFNVLSSYKLCIGNSNFLAQIKKDPNQFRDFVWKLLNLYQKPTKMIKQFKQIGVLSTHLNKHKFSTINFIGWDIQMLYNPIIDFIEYRKNQILKQYINNILPLKIADRSLYKQKTMELSRKPGFSELKAMLEELGHVNQVVVYIFNGCFHSKFIVDAYKPKRYTSTNDAKFDKIYQIYEFIGHEHKKVETRQKSRQKIKYKQNTFISHVQLNTTNKVVGYKSSKIHSLIQETKIKKKISKAQFITNKTQSQQILNQL